MYFNGFNSTELSDNNTQLYIFDFSKFSMVLNLYLQHESIITYFDEFITERNIQIQLVDHYYSLNIYNNPASGISKMYFFGCNIKNPLIINRFNYQRQIAGGIILQPGNIEKIDLPLILQVTEYVVNTYYTYETSIFTVRENAQLYVTGGSINGTFTKKRGSVVIADYQNAYASFSQVYFSTLQGFNGGVFFVHYNSLVEFDQCTFYNSSGIMNGLGTVENNGRFRITNSVFERIFAIKTSFLAMTDNPLVKSEFINCTFKNDSTITLDYYLDEFIEDFYRSLIENDLIPVVKRLNVGTKYSSKILRSNLEFENCVFENENRLIDIYLSNSNLILDNVKFLSGNYDFQSASRNQFLIQVQLFSYLKLINCLFDSVNIQTLEYEGNLIEVQYTTTEIINSKFTTQYCEYSYYDNVNFTNNYATVMGGGGYTDLYFPLEKKSDDQLFFKNNYAPYGPIIASYPLRVRISSYDFQTDLISGQQYNGTIVAELIDVIGAVCTLDSTSTIQVQEIDIETTKVTGNKQIQVRNGRVEFSQLTFSAKPGSKNVQFRLFSPQIQTELLQKVLPQIDKSLINNAIVSFNFRSCIEGEIFINNECQKCDDGSYSLFAYQSGQDQNAGTQCYDCVDNAECKGGYDIGAKSGYWRSSFYSTQVHQCVNSASCLGGPINVNTKNPQEQCASGYGGNLCEKCLQTSDSSKKVKLSDNSCEECPSKAVTVLSLIGLYLAIATNYIQIMISSAAFNLSLPEYMQSFIFLMDKFGTLFDRIINVECLIEIKDLEERGISIVYIKATGMSLIPLIAFISLMAVQYGVAFILRKKQHKKINKDRMILTIIVVFFTMHPSLTKQLFALFNCIEIDTNQFWLKSDLQVECWSPSHTKWALGAGIPLILLLSKDLILVFALYYLGHSFSDCLFKMV
eukprot:403371110